MTGRVKYVRDGHLYYYTIGLLPGVLALKPGEASLLIDEKWQEVPCEEAREACRAATIHHLKEALAELEAGAHPVPESEEA